MSIQSRASTETFIMREATAGDAPAIRNLIRAVRINPFGLDWRRFVVASTPEGQIIGCGQVKLHPDGTRELASIAVRGGWRRRGIAREVIQRLMASHPGSLYLTCRARLGKFYAKFGFRRVEPAEMPAHYRRLQRLIRVLRNLKLLGEDLWVMRADN